MKKDRSAEDTISEKEYTMRMRRFSTDPQEDSPGDSEADAGAEFEMGLEFLPDPSKDPELVDEDSIDELEAAETELNPQTPAHDTFKTKDDKERPADPKLPKHEALHLPESAKVVSSDPPAPWLDLDKKSSTH
ncbi:MAG: hypothetical protein ACXVAX_11210 [Pseudobdellovibrio sp.]